MSSFLKFYSTFFSLRINNENQRQMVKAIHLSFSMRVRLTRETIRTRSMMFDFHQTYPLPLDSFPTKETNYWPNVEIFSELAGSVHGIRHRKYKYEKGQSGIGIKWLAKRTNLENASSLAHNVSIVRSQAMPPIVDRFFQFFFFFFLFFYFFFIFIFFSFHLDG